MSFESVTAKNVTFASKDEILNPEDVSPPLTLDHVQTQVDTLKSMVSSMYIPQHFTSMMEKIGQMTKVVEESQRRVQHCYVTTLLTITIAIFCVGIAFFVLYTKKGRSLLGITTSRRFSKRRAPAKRFSSEFDGNVTAPDLMQTGARAEVVDPYQ